MVPIMGDICHNSRSHPRPVSQKLHRKTSEQGAEIILKLVNFWQENQLSQSFISNQNSDFDNFINSIISLCSKQ